MIQPFVDKFIASKDLLISEFQSKRPESYESLVNRLISLIGEGEYNYDLPDPKRIHTINDGDYQGTLLFIIGCQGYQPSMYWSIFVSYGSCSGCDTFEAISDYSDEVSIDQANEYYTLMLHMVQNMRKLVDE